MMKSDEEFKRAIAELQNYENQIAFSAALEELSFVAGKGEIRDYDWFIDSDLNLYRSIFVSLKHVWKNLGHDYHMNNEHEFKLLMLWARIVQMEEYGAKDAYDTGCIDPSFVEMAIERIMKVALYIDDKPSADTLISPHNLIRCLQQLVLHIYQHQLPWRSEIRKCLVKNIDITLHAHSNVPSKFDGGQSRNHVQFLLQLLHSIIGGFYTLKDDESHHDNNILRNIRSELLHEVLIPLHQPNEMILWRDQTPIIQNYHEELVRCVIALVESDSTRSVFVADTYGKGSTLLTEAINEILTLWPESFNTNTPKQVLLLHELEMLVERCYVEEFKTIQHRLLTRLVSCIGTNADNIRPAQRALQFFKHTKILDLFLSKEKCLIDPHYTIEHYSLQQLVPSLYRHGQISWNPTVNKMTAFALKNLMEHGMESFRARCVIMLTPNAVGSGEQGVPDGKSAMPKPVSSENKEEMKSSTGAAFARPVRPVPSTGGMRPPAANSSSGNTMIPPAPTSKYMATLEKGSQPPVTITGVAPWAMSKTTGNTIEEKPVKTIPPTAGEKQEKMSTKADGFQLMIHHMKKCYEYVFDESKDPHTHKVNSWTHEQAAIKPLLLPDLKFHDLVFGQVLGEGAFSTVKYARHITKGKTQSAWPEFAVKIIDTNKLIQYNYSLSVIREIAILKILFHPNIARMVSAFRFQNSAYLILEYASKGDLHSFLLQVGKLEHQLIRFIIGEITTAIQAVHEQGFCYNDLKPENILITELGHVKLTDFGACRPITKEANQLLIDSCDQLMIMRNGNWKNDDLTDEEEAQLQIEEAKLQDAEQKQAETTANDNKEETSGKSLKKHINFKQLFNTERMKEQLQSNTTECEGTPAYMPPETISVDGNIYSQGQDPKADAWAIGCVVYFCYHGRPRFFGEVTQVMEQLDMWFDECTSSSSHHHRNTSEDKGNSSGGGEMHVHFSSHSPMEDATASTATGTAGGAGAGHHVDVLQDKACEEFIRSLLERDPRKRISAFAALDHPYLLQGILPHSLLAPTDETPCLYHPRSLHQTTPPQWPHGDGSGVNAQDSRWARRQFSTLWAPMPPQYDLQSSNATASAASKVIKISHQDDIPYALLRKPLPIIEECDFEQYHSFLGPPVSSVTTLSTIQEEQNEHK